MVQKVHKKPEQQKAVQLGCLCEYLSSRRDLGLGSEAWHSSSWGRVPSKHREVTGLRVYGRKVGVGKMQ